MQQGTLYLGNDHLVTLATLTDQDNVPMTAATVQVLVFDSLGQLLTAVASTMAHVAAGTYEGVLPLLEALKEGRIYVVQVTAEVLGVRGQWDVECLAKRRV